MLAENIRMGSKDRGCLRRRYDNRNNERSRRLKDQCLFNRNHMTKTVSEKDKLGIEK